MQLPTRKGEPPTPPSMAQKERFSVPGNTFMARIERELAVDEAMNRLMDEMEVCQSKIEALEFRVKELEIENAQNRSMRNVPRGYGPIIKRDYDGG